jgi:hypothetical protein
MSSIKKALTNSREFVLYVQDLYREHLYEFSQSPQYLILDVETSKVASKFMSALESCRNSPQVLIALSTIRGLRIAIVDSDFPIVEVR